jgi:hypothetical protein
MRAFLSVVLTAVISPVASADDLPANWNRLPTETKLQVAKKLDAKSLAKLGATSKENRAVMQDVVRALVKDIQAGLADDPRRLTGFRESDWAKIEGGALKTAATDRVRKLLRDGRFKTGPGSAGSRENYLETLKREPDGETRTRHILQMWEKKHIVPK